MESLTLPLGLLNGYNYYIWYSVLIVNQYLLQTYAWLIATTLMIDLKTTNCTATKNRNILGYTVDWLINY